MGLVARTAVASCLHVTDTLSFPSPLNPPSSLNPLAQPIMAHLPPRAPAMPPNSHTNTTAAADRHPSWPLDDFLHFSSPKAATHRRSSSDSMAFLDDEQNHFNSIFSDVDFGCPDAGVPPPPHIASPSSPSDQNSDNDADNHMSVDQSPAPATTATAANGEDDSSCKAGQPHPNPDYSVFDPKRVKRVLANRQSAQRSRVRKLQYISDLERSVTSLQTEVSALSPRVAFLDHQRLILNVDNSALKQRLAALAQDKIFKDAHQEALKNEIERLRQVYNQQQSMKKINIAAEGAAAPPQATA